MAFAVGSYICSTDLHLQLTRSEDILLFAASLGEEHGLPRMEDSRVAQPLLGPGVAVMCKQGASSIWDEERLRLNLLEPGMGLIFQ